VNAIAVSRHEHALALIHADLSALGRRVASWIAEACNWRTGLMPRFISARGLSRELRADHREARRALAEVKRAQLLDVAERGPLGVPRYALRTPTKPLRWIDDELDCDVTELEEPPPVEVPVEPEVAPPAGTAGAIWQRVRELAAGVVAGVVQSTSPAGPEPTFVPRPQFAAEPIYRPLPPGVRVPVEMGQRGRGGAPTRVGGALGWLDPGPEPQARYRPPERRASSPFDALAALDDDEFASAEDIARLRREGRLDDAHSARDVQRERRTSTPDDDSTEVPLDLDVDPVEGARHVGQLYRSREEAIAARKLASCVPTGPADEAPHRRIELLWRRYEVEGHGWACVPLGDAHDAIRWLLATLGLDEVEELIHWAHGPGRRHVMLTLPGLRYWVARRMAHGAPKGSWRV
jgi:hypothetical protein